MAKNRRKELKICLVISMEKHLMFQITDLHSPATAAIPNGETDEDDVEETHLENPSDKKSELDGEELGVEEIEAPSGEGFEVGDDKSDPNVDSSSEDLSSMHKVCSNKFVFSEICVIIAL